MVKPTMSLSGILKMGNVGKGKGIEALQARGGRGR